MEGMAQTIDGFSLLLMLGYTVPYVLIYLRNQRGKKLSNNSIELLVGVI